jgi:hypothetical protein
LTYYEFTTYKLRVYELALSGLNGKNSDLFQIIDYELVQEFFSKLGLSFHEQSEQT